MVGPAFVDETNVPGSGKHQGYATALTTLIL